jgi:hypothetical protein
VHRLGAAFISHAPLSSLSFPELLVVGQEGFFGIVSLSIILMYISRSAVLSFMCVTPLHSSVLHPCYINWKLFWWFWQQLLHPAKQKARGQLGGFPHDGE